MEEAVRNQQWSLADDYGFYNFQKDFSERIFEKTRNTQRELEGLMSALDAAETQVNNASGSLDILSLNQFVERRIEVQCGSQCSIRRCFRNCSAHRSRSSPPSFCSEIAADFQNFSLRFESCFGRYGNEKSIVYVIVHTTHC